MKKGHTPFHLLTLLLAVVILTGCEEEVTPISAGFIADVTELVAGNSVTFTDNSTGEATAWSWTFQGGIPASSTEQNPPAVLYRGAGAFNVSLTVTGPEGTDTRSMEAFINVTPPPCEGGVTSVTYHGREYRVVGIGSQCWFEENLATTKYRNGTDILNITDTTEWNQTNSTGTAAYCWFDNLPSNADTKGALYNWYAISSPNGLCPDGWHVATDDDFKEMKMHLGLQSQYVDLSEHGEDIQLGPMLKSFFGWDASVTGGHNSSGFNGMPHGRRNENGHFGGQDRDGYWWTASEFSATRGWSHYLRGNRIHSAARGSADKRFGYSCRCVKD